MNKSDPSVWKMPLGASFSMEKHKTLKSEARVPTYSCVPIVCSLYSGFLPLFIVSMCTQGSNETCETLEGLQVVWFHDNKKVSSSPWSGTNGDNTSTTIC